MPLFLGLPDDVIHMICLVLRPMPVRKGEVIIREGDLGETLFFVVEGEAFAEIKGEVVMRYESGDYFGELSLLTGAQLTRMKPLLNDASPHECPLIN